MLSATALKNRDSGHTNIPRVLWGGTDKRDKNYRRYRRALKWGIMKQAETAVREAMTDEVHGRTLHVCKQHEETEGGKILFTSFSTSRGIKWSKQATVQNKEILHREHTSAVNLCTGCWRCQQFIMVERTTNTSLNEKNLSRTVQEIAPLMLELPEPHITHGWRYTDISRLQGSCAIHLPSWQWASPRLCPNSTGPFCCCT